MVGIYKISNKINGKIYIGESVNIATRWYAHINELESNKHYNTNLQSEWNEFGADNFMFEIIKLIDDKNLTETEIKANLIYEEKLEIDKYNIELLYNIENTFEDVINNDRYIKKQTELKYELCKLSGIDIDEKISNSEKYCEKVKEEYTALIESNINITHNIDLKLKYPNLYKLIHDKLDFLIKMFDISLENLDVKLQNNYIINDIPIFYCSYKYIKDTLNIRQGDVSQNINLFNLLGLINKLNPNDLPKNMCHMLTYYKIKSKVKNQVNTYSISKYTPELLKQAEEIAIKLKENNFTLRGFGWEYIYRTFGKEVADKLFPQNIDRVISDISKERQFVLKDIIIDNIQNKKYISEPELCENLMKKCNLSIDIAKTQVKRCIQELLNDLNLVRIQSNKQLKEHFGISSNGYPFILLKKESYEQFIKGCDKNND